LELEAMIGAVVRYGRVVDVPTPVHRVAYAALKPSADGTGEAPTADSSGP
jgi:ketopantoate reductase